MRVSTQRNYTLEGRTFLIYNYIVQSVQISYKSKKVDNQAVNIIYDCSHTL